MRELIVGVSTDVAYSDSCTGQDTITALTNGAIAVIQEDGTLVSGAAPVFTKDNFYVALGRSVGGVYHSQLVNRATCNVIKTAYTAPVAKQYTNTFAIVGTLAVGTAVSLEVINQDKPFHELNRVKYYEYVTVAGDTAATIGDAFNALITADIAKSTSIMYGVIASVSDNNAGVLTVVGVAGKNFTIANYDLPSTVTNVIAISVPLVRGVGTYADMLEFEQKVSTEDGNANVLTNKYNLYTVPSRVEAGVSYIQYRFSWTQPRNEVMPTSQTPVQELIVAVKDNNAIETALDLIIAAI